MCLADSQLIPIRLPSYFYLLQGPNTNRFPPCPQVIHQQLAKVNMKSWLQYCASFYKRSALSGTALSSTQRCPGQSSAWLSAVWDSVQLDSGGSGQRSVWLNAVPDSAQLDSKLHLGQCSAWLSALMLSIQCSAGLNAVGTMPSLNKRGLGHCSVLIQQCPRQRSARLSALPDSAQVCILFLPLPFAHKMQQYVNLTANVM